MNPHQVAILIYGDINSPRNALTEEKYKSLAEAFLEQGCRIESVVYNDAIAEKLASQLLGFDAILVWVNPIEQGNNRDMLDNLLINLSKKGVFVSTHPEVILKMGTKDILYKTREEDFGSSCFLYYSFEDFEERFLETAQLQPISVLKQWRGNGGNGVFKIDTSCLAENRIGITHAKGNDGERWLTLSDFLKEMSFYFANNGRMIQQDWNPNIIHGMLRCYVTGTSVSGFGYQEINALYPSTDSIPKIPSKRYYFTEACGLFSDLKEIMESNWIPALQKLNSIENKMMPVIWDADFFINNLDGTNTKEKYTLCEINVSCVSPFPESSIPFIVKAVIEKLEGKNN